LDILSIRFQTSNVKDIKLLRPLFFQFEVIKDIGKVGVKFLRK